jgi:hypothetical protein
MIQTRDYNPHHLMSMVKKLLKKKSSYTRLRNHLVGRSKDFQQIELSHPLVSQLAADLSDILEGEFVAMV